MGNGVEDGVSNGTEGGASNGVSDGVEGTIKETWASYAFSACAYLFALVSIAEKLLLVFFSKRKKGTLLETTLKDGHSNRVVQVIYFKSHLIIAVHIRSKGVSIRLFNMDQ